MQIKKILLFFIILISFFFLQVDGVFAAELEVQYPTLQTGATVTSQSDLAQYLKYIFDLGIFIGFLAVFLSLVWAGVLYLISPAKPDTLSMARDRVTGAISGLLILATLYLIITTINPELKFFRLNKLDEIPPPPPTTQPAGVNFYNSQDCSGVSDTNTTSIPDLGDLKNKINSVSIIHDYKGKTYYIAILYDNINYWGKCQYINPNKACHPVSPFAASASIHTFSFAPSGNIMIYRKSFFNEMGGFLKISALDVIKDGGIYIEGLKNLEFRNSSSGMTCVLTLEEDYKKCCKTPGREGEQDCLEWDLEKECCCNVPMEERDCIKWNFKGECLKSKCPNLAEENISSIKIDGNYLVLLVYFSPSDNPWGPWTYCQSFPTKNDINKEGPEQIKWEAVRNRGQDPNFMVIIPVKQK